MEDSLHLPLWDGACMDPINCSGMECGVLALLHVTLNCDLADNVHKANCPRNNGLASPETDAGITIDFKESGLRQASSSYHFFQSKKVYYPIPKNNM